MLARPAQRNVEQAPILLVGNEVVGVTGDQERSSGFQPLRLVDGANRLRRRLAFPYAALMCQSRENGIDVRVRMYLACLSEFPPQIDPDVAKICARLHQLMNQLTEKSEPGTSSG